ncbi:MAG: methylated-DNA--[protein]-cysteine S-methyltransferase [Thermaerobacter sp.]|nr:methylated-DNA--[protein]-cysteine S-methyltransferase [Thermaerobacter sp.]
MKSLPGQPFVPHPVATTHYVIIPSQVGNLLLTGDGEALTGVYFGSQHSIDALDQGCRRDQSAFRDARAQFSAYFAGELREFSLALAPKGTAFQLSIWAALCTIPYGETESYSGLARRIGRETAARAVGRANGQNPIPIVIPCHRVIGRNGTLTGYGGGLATKQQLLALEAGQLNWMRGSANA